MKTLVEQYEEAEASREARLLQEEERLRAKLNAVVEHFLNEANTPDMRKALTASLANALRAEPPMGDEENTDRQVIVESFEDDPKALTISVVGRMRPHARHKHDCDRCRYLGTSNLHDLYFCEKQIVGPTIIARWGSDGPEYTSGLEFGRRPPRRSDSYTMRSIRVAYVLLGRLGILVPGYVRPEAA